MKKVADWIADMIDTALTNYNGRQIVLWGKYGVSDEIRRILKKKHDITNVIYVDGDSDLQDKKKVFSPNILAGNSDKYYVLVPLAVHKSIEHMFSGGGIAKKRTAIIFATVWLRKQMIIMKMHMAIQY